MCFVSRFLMVRLVSLGSRLPTRLRMPSCSQPSIGIGGHLTMPPLPHHRAYGSVPRRFGGLSVQQLLHGRQAQTFEVRIGEGAVHCIRGTQSPRPLGAEDGLTGRPFGDVETTEFPVSPATRLPLDPDDAT